MSLISATDIWDVQKVNWNVLAGNIVFTITIGTRWEYQIHIVDFPPFSTRETTFVTSCFHSCTPSIFWKGFTLNRKNLLRWSKFFPFRVDLFLEGRQKHFWQSWLLWVYLLPWGPYHTYPKILTSPFIIHWWVNLKSCWVNSKVEPWLDAAFFLPSNLGLQSAQACLS